MTSTHLGTLNRRSSAINLKYKRHNKVLCSENKNYVEHTRNDRLDDDRFLARVISLTEMIAIINEPLLFCVSFFMENTLS